MGQVKKIKQLVIDSGAFLKNVPVWDYGEEFYSVPEVRQEIKDKQAQEFLLKFPYEITWTQPKPSTIKLINDFTKKTGEFNSLSLADVKILALTYDLEVEAKGGEEHLRKEPVQRKTENESSLPPPPPKQIPGFYTPSNKKGLAKKKNEILKNIESSTKVLEINDASKVTKVDEGIASLNINQGSENEESEEDSDEEGWITPSNVKSLQSRENSIFEDDYKDVHVACISSDFAVQNTLLHIGLKAIGVNGKLIKSLRMYILRCFVCRTMCSDPEKLFCYKCGYKTLKKVSYTLNSDGTKYIWLSRKPINTRGMKYSLPAPKGGKHARNPVLCADQRVPQMKASKRSLQRNDPLHEDYIVRAGESPFTYTHTETRAALRGINQSKSSHLGTYYWDRRNPNDPGKNVKSRKKR